ncbi:DUF998 domain-containing protein [Alkalihalobacillus oceani]|uniref:DUF998 domain-containing protein n=1 Tax=Halalkalibacter oceani TaxID=1653776 RepID=UPI00203EEC6E|nr:DUF998 domain-containing protein [Halalkalibacter oceani]MCM3762518.1 DUF998 domain-containing protein [Halalkalibacter oceani]
MSGAYMMMAIVGLTVLAAIVAFRRHSFVKWGGWLGWLLISAYFLVEYVVILNVTAPYDVLHQPMSDLGVTVCGTGAYMLTENEICSPYHLLINWSFTLSGLATIVGALGLRAWWPAGRKVDAALWLLVVHGLSNMMAGIVPADVDFWLHTLGSIPGMIVQIPALLILGLAIRRTQPLLALWTFICWAGTTAALVFLFYQPEWMNLPGGLLQRVLYAAVYLWMGAVALAIWRRQRFSA